MYELSKHGLLMVKSLRTLDFANNVLMGNTRGLVSNPPYTTPREYLTIFIPICGGLQESLHFVVVIIS